jgi:DNA invertase Pin-like site-specific DNA recombinase
VPSPSVATAQHRRVHLHDLPATTLSNLAELACLVLNSLAIGAHPHIDRCAFRHEGDVLMVTRIDRLARSIVQDIVGTVRAKGASLKATEQPIDTSTAAGKCFLDMLGVFAEFETNLRRERQLEGIANAKAAGVYKGRPASIDVTKVREMKAQGMGASEIAKALKIGRASVYRGL